LKAKDRPDEHTLLLAGANAALVERMGTTVRYRVFSAGQPTADKRETAPLDALHPYVAAVDRYKAIVASLGTKLSVVA
jgi:hypothetical protein